MKIVLEAGLSDAHLAAILPQIAHSRFRRFSTVHGDGFETVPDSPMYAHAELEGGGRNMQFVVTPEPYEQLLPGYRLRHMEFALVRTPAGDYAARRIVEA